LLKELGTAKVLLICRTRKLAEEIEDRLVKIENKASRVKSDRKVVNG
jgi:hypothetical protein